MAAKVTPLIVLVGETASGKTALGIKLAKQLNGEIICADSRTVYKGMDIGTAKPTQKERSAVPHHLLDIIDPNQKYNVAQFQHDANKLIKDITKRGKVPIIVGGTGLYVDAVIFDYDFDNETMSDLRPNTLVLGIKRNKDELKERITVRVDKMVKQGFIDEVRHIGNEYGWDTEAMKGIGYRAFADYIRGKINLSEAKRRFVQGDMLLAKRQRTWFRRPVYQEIMRLYSDGQTVGNKSIHWVENPSDAVDIATTFLSKI